MIGRIPGPYEILSFIGSGGMGEVRKARDTRLGRIAHRDLKTGDIAVLPLVNISGDRKQEYFSSGLIPTIHHFPIYDPLHFRPRDKALLRKMNLEA